MKVKQLMALLVSLPADGEVLHLNENEVLESIAVSVENIYTDGDGEFQIGKGEYSISSLIVI
jgi:hypothetical protein